MTHCPCQAANSTISFESCCGPYLSGTRRPPTAEALMRSRYTAYTRVDIDYLRKTLAPESRHDFDASATRKWAKDSKWKGLEIRRTEKGQASDSEGVVEFVAHYAMAGREFAHREISRFRQEEGQWYFIDGDVVDEGQEAPVRETVVRDQPKLGRNDPCHCGSGKKYKKCCGANDAAV